MKKTLFALAIICAVENIYAARPNWLTSLPEAVEQATQEKKLVLLDFTGSDWCGWCMKLDDETFSRAEFIEYADKNLVLVQVDFPTSKPQSSDLKKANRALKKKYGVGGFPTVLMIKPDGKVLWEQDGYVEGGAGVMIAAAERCRRAAGLPVTASATPKPPKPAPAPVAAAPPPQPAPPPQKPAYQPKLKAILYSSTHASVVLDDATCEEGDFAYGMRIVKISRNEVTVECDGQIKVLRMK